MNLYFFNKTIKQFNLYSWSQRIIKTSVWNDIYKQNKLLISGFDFFTSAISRYSGNKSIWSKALKSKVQPQYYHLPFALWENNMQHGRRIHPEAEGGGRSVPKARRLQNACCVMPQCSGGQGQGRPRAAPHLGPRTSRRPPARVRGSSGLLACLPHCCMLVYGLVCFCLFVRVYWVLRFMFFQRKSDTWGTQSNLSMWNKCNISSFSVVFNKENIHHHPTKYFSSLAVDTLHMAVA